MRRVFADRAGYLADPDYSSVPVQGSRLRVMRKSWRERSMRSGRLRAKKCERGSRMLAEPPRRVQRLQRW